MDQKLQNDIIQLTIKNVLKHGSYSIKEAANDLAYHNITLSEQKKLAKLIVKSKPFVSELNNRVIIVKQNKLFDTVEAVGDDTNARHKVLEYVIWGIVALLAYLVFEVFLPGLKK